jgi:hypothetical protein
MTDGMSEASRDARRGQREARDAIAIYAVAGRDPIDALDLINECASIGTLRLLYDMVSAKGTEKTDVALNELLVPIVRGRLTRLGVFVPDIANTKETSMAQSIIQPDKLPSVQTAIDLFVAWRDNSSLLLQGLAPIELFKHFSIDIDHAWFVGSCVWYPAVLGVMFPDDSDIDIVFATEPEARSFCEHVQSMLAAQQLLLSIGTNVHGGAKFLRDGKGFLDVWWLPEGISIAEHVMGWKHDHEAELDECDVGVIELTDQSAALVERLVAGPGEAVPRLAAALARTR